MKPKTKTPKVTINPASKVITMEGGAFSDAEEACKFVREARNLPPMETREATPAAPATPAGAGGEGEPAWKREGRLRAIGCAEKRVLAGLPAATMSGSPVSIDEFRGMSYEEQRMTDQAKTTDVGGLVPSVSGRSSESRDAGGFSFGRMVRSMFDAKPVDGVEREILDDGADEARSAGIKSNGFMVSSRAFQSVQEYRTMSVTGGTGGNQGGMTVATQKAPLLASLFDSLFVVKAGATVYDQLEGNLDLPLIVDGADPDHKAENATAGETSPTTDMLSLSPKRLPTFIDVSNQLLMQGSDKALSDTIERHLRAKLYAIMERMFLNGSGASSQPRGILQTSGIGAEALGTDGAVPTYAALCNLIREVSVDNALGNGTASFAINSKVAAKLKTIAKLASTDSMTLIDDRAPGLLAGYPYFESNAVPSDLTKGTGEDLSAVIFANWVDFIIGQWSGVEILVDPYTKRAEGYTRIHAAVYYDAGCVRPQSFAAITDAITV